MLYINDATVSSVAETLLIASKDISPHFAIISSYDWLFRYDGANMQSCSSVRLYESDAEKNEISSITSCSICSCSSAVNSILSVSSVTVSVSTCSVSAVSSVTIPVSESSITSDSLVQTFPADSDSFISVSSVTISASESSASSVTIFVSAIPDISSARRPALWSSSPAWSVSVFSVTADFSSSCSAVCVSAVSFSLKLFSSCVCWCSFPATSASSISGAAVNVMQAQSSHAIIRFFITGLLV